VAARKTSGDRFSARRDEFCKVNAFRVTANAAIKAGQDPSCLKNLAEKSPFMQGCRKDGGDACRHGGYQGY
jgi:hypothetical protein